MRWKTIRFRKQSGIILFYITGFCGLCWFLIRVIPKPSRAAYPCQRAAFPLASGFILHLAGLITGSQLFRKGIQKSREKNLAGLLWILPAILIIVLAGLGTGKKGLLAGIRLEQYTEEANHPVGKGRGVIPGRVVWVWNPDAVNENCPNTWLEEDNWWMEHNTDREKVHGMLESSLCILTGTDLTIDAWDSIFRHFNRERGAGDVAYQEGEKVCIKTNFVSCDATNMDGHNKKENLNMIDASPQIMWSVLNQLSNVCGILQSDICIGDPSAYFPNQYHDLLKTDFPDVVYLSLEDAPGRTKIISSSEEVLQFSDESGGDYLPVQFTEADYMINISVTKHHGSAGFTQIAKNHYGSNMRNTAEHMHATLVYSRQGTRKYRHFVDLLGHEDLGGNTMLNIGDFLWSGHQAWTTPDKFTTAPFLNDYPSSILVSMDPLAVESVGLDFIQTQSWGDPYATITGVDDYLFQAADSSYWPRGINYDPENDGSVLESLGVFEHWNNDEDKQYSGNLGMQGGIELVMVLQHRKIVSPTEFTAVYMEDPQGILLSWRDLSESEEAYLLERSEGNGDHFTGLAGLGPNETTFTDADIEPGMLYHYRIRTAAGGDTTIAETISQLAAPVSSSRDLRWDRVPFRLFPNPASDVLNIQCSPGTAIISVSIIDMNGSLLKQFRPARRVNRTQYTLSCQDLGRGSYLVRVDTDGGDWTLPLLVVK
jgi:hypothetical protein